jgi:hypothetical protein
MFSECGHLENARLLALNTQSVSGNTAGSHFLDHVQILDWLDNGPNREGFFPPTGHLKTEV